MKHRARHRRALCVSAAPFSPEFAGFTWGFVTTRNIPALKKVVRINISLPEVLVQEIDAYAQARGMSRSAFLALAAEHEMADA
jgi:hypothetical protein